MINKINALLKEVENLKAANAEELEALRIKYLSKKGEISLLMNDFRKPALRMYRRRMMTSTSPVHPILSN